jgi:nitrogen regulatory protein PII
MKKIEISPHSKIAEPLILALSELDLDIEGFILDPIVNMGREDMRPRYGDWDYPPPPDYRKKIEIVAQDNQVNQIIETIQRVVRENGFLPPKDYGNEIFISSVEKVFCISLDEN